MGSKPAPTRSLAHRRIGRDLLQRRMDLFGQRRRYLGEAITPVQLPKFSAG